MSSLVEAVLRRQAEERLQGFKFVDTRPPSQRGRGGGVPMTSRLCSVCADNRLAVTNRTGICSRCKDRHKRRLNKWGRAALSRREGWVSDGAGI